MNTFIKQHSVRIFALVSAAATILAAQFPEIPWEGVAGLAAAVLGVGEVSQRSENKKTAQALASTPTAVPEPEPVEELTPAPADPTPAAPVEPANPQS